jgi:Ser/Thr protein kinase RdoA (MazF antagonist)
MAESNVPMDELLACLDRLANESLSLWDLSSDDANARLINISENATYLVEAQGWKSILRIHRANYHTRRSIECELDWSKDLNDRGGLITPEFYLGRDGNPIQESIVEGLTESRYMVMFHFVEGAEPDENQNMIQQFEQLGEIAAKTHVHSMQWQRPQTFERLIWNLEAFFGDNPTWGNWRDAPNVTEEITKVLERVEATVTRRLNSFGQSSQQYGLIHADMRLANLLIDDNGTRLIDFDDCGDGWYLYDFASSISFIEDHPQIPALKAAWVKGYRKVRNLSEADVEQLDTFTMLRRLALLAWIGSHIEAPEPQVLAKDFARISAVLGSNYLDKYA